MTNVRTQDDFAPFEFLSDGSLNIHRHPARPDTLAVFVHGLMGEGYATWGEFPRFLFESQMDVALFDYPTGLRRTKNLRNATPEDSARLLAQEISSLEHEYEHVVLLGHSMGGLVAGLAAYDYFNRIQLGKQSHLQPLAGLLAFASPLGGSIAVTVPGLADLRFLAKGNRILREYREFKSRMLDVEVSTYPNTNRYSFPTFSLSAHNDVWVRRTNSSLDIPIVQAEDCGGTHTRLVKPEDLQHKSVQWTLSTIARVRLMRVRVRHLQSSQSQQRLVDPQFVPGLLVAKLWDTSEPDWVTAFTEALSATAETFSLTVLDSREVRQDLPPNIVIHALHAEDVLTREPDIQSDVLDELRLHSDSTRTQVALGPTGIDCHAAEAALKAWLLHAAVGTRPWVAGVTSNSELARKITEWLRVIAKIHLHTASSLPDRRRKDALESALGGAAYLLHQQTPFDVGE